LKAGPNNIIRGKVYYDIDKNGIATVNEPFVPGIWVKTGKDTINTKAGVCCRWKFYNSSRYRYVHNKAYIAFSK
jgi:hypothetical protein